MATIHTCDRCGAEVGDRSDLWALTLAPVEKKVMFDERKFERWELCDRCKKQLYVAIHEKGGGTLHEPR